MTKALRFTIVVDSCSRKGCQNKGRKGKDREEYTKTAARERKQMLKASLGEDLWNVALEPERRKLCDRFVSVVSKRSRMIPVNG